MRRGRKNHPVLFNTSFQKPFRIGLGAPKYVLHMVSGISIAIRIALRVLEELYYWKKNDFIIEKKCKRVKFVSPKNGLLSKRTIIGGSEGGTVKDHPFTDFYAPFH